MKIEKAIEEALNRNNISLLVYLGLNLWLLENVKSKKQHFALFLISVFGFEVFLNYLDDTNEVHKYYHELEYETVNDVSYYDAMEESY